jgi:hypothetical protein
MSLRQSKKNATDSDVRRMYIRGRKGALEVRSVPLEEALALARISPKLRPAKKKPLSVPDQEIVVIPAAIASLQRSSGRKKKSIPWSVGHATSRSVIRPKFPPIAAPGPEPVKPKPSKLVNTKTKVVPRKQKMSLKRPAQKGKPKKSYSFSSGFEGQPRFEGGIRFVQGGLPELGKR